MAEKKRKRVADSINQINVTPMVDVMLVLLVIFMVITPMLSKGVSVDMVKTRNPIAMEEADKEDALVVAITRDGKVFLGRGQVEPKELGTEVGDVISERLDKTVYIKSDARAKYQKVVDVINILRSTGVDQVGLLTERLGQGGMVTME
jgi:biopolymer transport protein ExbD/biopolymer transport protein TolR